jgi:hypothetical protein
MLYTNKRVRIAGVLGTGRSLFQDRIDTVFRPPSADFPENGADSRPGQRLITRAAGER